MDKIIEKHQIKDEERINSRKIMPKVKEWRRNRKKKRYC